MGRGEKAAETRTKRICENLESSFAPGCLASQFPLPQKPRRSLRSGEPDSSPQVAKPLCQSRESPLSTEKYYHNDDLLWASRAPRAVLRELICAFPPTTTQQRGEVTCPKQHSPQVTNPGCSNRAKQQADSQTADWRV